MMLNLTKFKRRARDVQEILGVKYPAANKLIGDFVELGILKEKTGFSRNRLFAMDDYIAIFRKK